MSNTICIKHGANAPSNGILQPFELGYITSTGTLVIGDANKKTKPLNYLSVDSDGYITSTGNVSMLSTDDYPKWYIKASEYNSAVSYGMQGSNGQACIFEYAPDSPTYYERYNLPQPAISLTANKTYAILTTKGGTFDGNFTFSGKLTANGAVVVDDTSYGTKDPNTAGTDGTALSGTTGQLYFVVTG